MIDDPGPHVTAAVEVAADAGLSPDMGPFATTATGVDPAIEIHTDVGDQLDCPTTQTASARIAEAVTTVGAAATATDLRRYTATHSARSPGTRRWLVVVGVAVKDGKQLTLRIERPAKYVEG